MSEPPEYRCPGERPSISRAVHLGRLARFYPACRTCPHRDDTGTLSTRQVKRLQETRRRGLESLQFQDESAGGVYLNDLDPTTVRQIASTWGVYAREQQPSQAEDPAIVLAGDGRSLTAELVAAASEGLRWAGCNVVDIGPATAPNAVFAVQHLVCDGGLLVGNPLGQAQTVGLRFWERLGRPFSFEGFESSLTETNSNRPVRKSGQSRRFQAQPEYLAGLAEHYHALRPLRFALETNCRALVEYVRTLTEPVACEMLPSAILSGHIPERAARDDVHFTVRVDGDGQRCRSFDERGRAISGERLFLSIARHVLGDSLDGPVVLEEDSSEALIAGVRALGGRTVVVDSRPDTFHDALGEQRAMLGGGPSGRFWYRQGNAGHAADALFTLTYLLKILSQSDRPLSRVLDADAPLE